MVTTCHSLSDGGKYWVGVAVHKLTSRKFNTPLPVRHPRPAGDARYSPRGPDGVAWRAQRPEVGINKPELWIRRDLAEVMDLVDRANDAALQTIRAQRMPSEIADPELAPRVVVAALACRRSVAIAIPGLGFALSLSPSMPVQWRTVGHHAAGASAAAISVKLRP
jgi:hypothetical protein